MRQPLRLQSDVWVAIPECWLLALQAAAGSNVGAFDDLLGGPSSSEASPSFPNIVAWQKDGITVTFSFSKPAGHPEVTQIEGSYSNTSDAAISDFSLQVRLWLSCSTSTAAHQTEVYALGWFCRLLYQSSCSSSFSPPLATCCQPMPVVQ